MGCDAAIGAGGEGCEWPRALSLLAEMTASIVQLNTIGCSVPDFEQHRSHSAYPRHQGVHLRRVGEKTSRLNSGDLTMDEFGAQVAARWNEIGDEHELVDQLRIYRATRGLENLDDFELCGCTAGSCMPMGRAPAASLIPWDSPTSSYARCTARSCIPMARAPAARLIPCDRIPTSYSSSGSQGDGARGGRLLRG